MEYWLNFSDKIDNEIWIPINEYEGFYEISNLGRIRSLDRTISIKGKKKRGIIMKQFKNPDGYLLIELYKHGIGRKFKVHRLVASHFILNSDNKPEVNHKRGIKTDNRVTELEWATTANNIKHAYDYLGKITPMKGKFGALCPNSKKVKCETLDMVFSSATEAASVFGFGITTVADICSGKRVQTNGLTFKYI